MSRSSTGRRGYPTLEQVEQTDNIEQALRWQIFLPHPINDEDIEIIDAVMERVQALRARDNDAFVQAHKNLTR